MRYMIPMTEMNVFLIVWIAGGALSVVVRTILHDELLQALGFGLGIPSAVQLVVENIGKNPKQKTQRMWDKNNGDENYTW